MAARRRHSNRRRRRGSFGFLYRMLSVLVICGVIVVALTLFFRVDTVVVTGTQRYTQQEVIDATGIKTGDNLFLMNKYDVAQNIVGELPYIEEIRINRKLPDTLLIQVEECGTPLALAQDGSAWLISSTGKIVDQKTAAEAADYGTIDGCELLAPSVGSSIALKTEYATQQSSLLKLLAALEDNSMMDDVDAIHLGDGSTLAMDYLDRFTVEMPYGAENYGRLMQILVIAVSQLETNQTGTIRLNPDGEYQARFMPGQRWEG